MPDEVTSGIEATETSAELAAESASAEASEVESTEASESENGAEAVETPEQQEAKPKLVPLAALHEERERRKELASRLEESERRSSENMGRLQERVNIILQSLKQQAEAVPQEDPNEPLFIKQFKAANPGVTTEQAEEFFFKEEPNNYFRYKQEQLQRQQEQLFQVAGKQQQSEESQARFASFMSAYQAKAAEFSSATPDFNAAYNFLLSHRDAELQTMGFTDPTQRQQIMKNEEIGIVDQAFRNNVNPAQRLYEIAKYRGYKPAAVAAESDTTNTAVPGSLEHEKKLIGASKSLGAVPSTTQTKLSAEALLSMSDDEFAEATRGGKWQKVFGS